jgi:hypothetical protein
MELRSGHALRYFSAPMKNMSQGTTNDSARARAEQHSTEEAMPATFITPSGKK